MIQPYSWNLKSFLFLALFYLSNSQNLGPSNQPEAYFNGSAYLRLQTTISLKRDIGLSFRTCAGGNLLSQKQSDNQIELSVNSDEVLFFAKTLGLQFSEIIRGNYLDNKWHVVQIKYALGNLTFMVDDQSKLIANSTYQEELLTSRGLYNEGSGVLLIGKQFNGCLLEGPSLVFNESIITSSPNVVFEVCPIPDDSCTPRENDYCRNEPCMRHGTCINGINGYTCSCLPRYTGKNCEFNITADPCEKNPGICKNGGICEPTSKGLYNCHCQPGFAGKNCEQELMNHPQCQQMTCLNGGTCVTNNGNSACACLPGYYGTKCEINVDDCKSSPCKNGGVCYDKINNFTCNCSNTGYTGRLCEINVNECLSNPCYNSGTCFDTYGGYVCQCLPGFGAPDCRTILNECLSQPCLNYGLCIDQTEGYKCRCQAGYGGERCQIDERQTFCDVNKCLPFGDCVEPDSNSHMSRCVCKSEYTGTYPNCTVDNICVNTSCKNGGTCTQWNGSYTCNCPAGFTGKNCQVRIDDCASYPCLHGGTCTNRMNSFHCNCTDQWMGTTCDIPYDACENKPCYNKATCITSPNKRDFTCNCLSGFTGVYCETNIDDCINVQCSPHKVCVDLVDKYECRCPPGYDGENCSIDINPCAKDPCSHGTCHVDKITHQFTCSCSAGYTGPRCENDIDECAENPTICNKGICQNKDGGFQCYCTPGYTGETCNLDFDECLSMPCRNEATCLNKINNYECVCPPGYEGKDCSININECIPMPCMEGSTCIDGVNAFTCVCQPGLSGDFCNINIDDCESSPCQHEALCIDGLNSYTCNCTDTGYMGIHCETNIDDCVGNPCKNDAECIDKVKHYECNCYPGYKGIDCEIDIDECESNPCRYNGTCLERSKVSRYLGGNDFNESLPDVFKKEFNYAEAAGYVCICVPGVTGENCEIDIDECKSSPCFEGTCVDKIGDYFCECNEGFEGANCEVDIDECEKYTPCHYGRCFDKKANYFCDCEPNYGGKNCSVELVGCLDNPCLNEGTCKPYVINETVHKFNCTCPSGFHGDMCERISTMSLTGKSMVVISTSREEGYDIQFRFKTTLGDGLLALGKGLTYYILELSKGRLNLHSSLLNKWEGVFIGSNLNDSRWQRVFVAINSTHLVLSANDEQTIYPISFNENNNSTNYTSFPLTYIGGIPSNLKKLTHGQPFLVGCTEDVHINGEWILPAVDTSSVQFQNIQTGCSRQPQCEPNPCFSGGHCTDLWLDFRCTCERPFLGHTCQYNYTAATFGYENISDSLVTVIADSTAKRAVRTIVDISMFIRTRQPRGQIFYLGSQPGASISDETYIAAQLEDGELLVRIQFNGSLEGYTVSGVYLHNGYNHLIEVIRNVTLVQVKLNGTEYFRKTIPANGTLDAQVLFLGGQPPLRLIRQANDNSLKLDTAALTTSSVIATPLTNVHFKGIIQDVQISNGSSTMIVEFFPLEAPDIDIPMSFGIVKFDKNTVLEGIRSDNLCLVNPCQHDGECEVTWNDYRCICPRGFKGKNCTELEFCEIEKCPIGSECNNLEDGYECIANATFDGKTPSLNYRFDPESPKHLVFDTLQVTYRTRSWGTLFFAKDSENNYFAIFIYHNEVVVQWRINTPESETKRFRREHFEGQWLSIYFQFKNSVLQGGFRDMIIDDSPNIKVNNFDFNGLDKIFREGNIYVGGSDSLSFDYQSIIDSSDNTTGYLAGSDTTTTVSITSNSLEVNELYPADTFLYKVDQNKKTDFFKGCINEVRIGKVLLPFFTATELVTARKYFELLPDEKPEIGCKLCYDADCNMKGVCINPLETYKCNCTEGYTAEDCSIDINECDFNQCINNSTCLDQIGKYQCICLDGYEGIHCEQEINECLSNPCLNNGTCEDLIGNFKCNCPSSYVGHQCEAPLLITCENKPCYDLSACKAGQNKNTGNNFTCICPEGMMGVYCERKFCDDKPCENGGQCLLENKIPLCKCERGYSGKFCEINIDDCVSPTGGSPCQNKGKCIDGIDRYDCNCTGTGYTGLLCEMDIDECRLLKYPCGSDPQNSCENTPGSYKCNCTSETKCGHLCNHDNPCLPDNPCVNGICISQCYDEPAYSCLCHNNYTGTLCSDYKVAASQSSRINILYIVIPIVLIISIGIAVGLALLVNVARSKRATRGTYSPSAQEFCNPRVELDHVLKPPPEERLI